MLQNHSTPLQHGVNLYVSFFSGAHHVLVTYDICKLYKRSSEAVRLLSISFFIRLLEYFSDHFNVTLLQCGVSFVIK